VEKPFGYYNRLVDRYTDSLYQEFLAELDTRLSRLTSGKQLTDIQYDDVFHSLNKIVGKEIALTWIGISPDIHEEIMANIKVKKFRKEFEFKNASDLEIDPYNLFNHITAAALGYTGDDRVALQEVGGLLL